MGEFFLWCQGIGSVVVGSGFRLTTFTVTESIVTRLGSEVSYDLYWSAGHGLY